MRRKKGNSHTCYVHSCMAGILRTHVRPVCCERKQRTVTVMLTAKKWAKKNPVFKHERLLAAAAVFPVERVSLVRSLPFTLVRACVRSFVRSQLMRR